MKPAFSDPPGARESNAGDEFHVLWVVRRVLAMLAPDAELQLVMMEGVTSVDAARIDPNLLLAADVTEYYGGRSFPAAKRVVASQLKYSERNPDRAWTPARLAQKGSRGGHGVIEGLARIYRGLSRDYDRNAILAKLSLRVVSNQAAHPVLLAPFLERVQELLAGTSTPVNTASLRAELSRPHAQELDRLYNASNLRSREFTDFLRLLDITELGSDARWRQEAAIVQTLAGHLLGDVRGRLQQLYTLVRKQALPEARDSEGLTRADVLAHLDVGSWEDLFPMPPRFTVPRQPIPTADAQALRDAVVAPEIPVILAHGGAGVGKTTSITTLESALPKGSAVVAYDCFGEGDYLTASHARHAEPNALQQIINELAVRCGTPLLLEPATPALRPWARLERVLATASESIAAEGGMLVLAVDAADNAMIAARERSQTAFVPDLWTIELPPGATLIVTCRTHRRELLRAPAGVFEIELCGFDEPASALNLRQRFPRAGRASCGKFHERSAGNPRSQFYVLDRSREDAVRTVAEAIEVAEVTPRTIFDDLLKAAVEQSADPHRAPFHLADLVAMTRPADLAVYASATGLDYARAAGFCKGLSPGVRLEGQMVAFRDEDFETFLRDQVGDEALVAAHGRLADHFLEHRNSDAAAAVAVAEHLSGAGRDDQLVALAVDEHQPDAVPDPVARLQAYFRRLELALQVAEQPEHRTNALRLAILAARAARTDRAVAAVVHRRPDLAMRYGDPDAVARIYDDEHSDPWRGPLHLRVAALYAREGNLDAAREQFALAQAWIRRWMRLEPSERQAWEIEAADVAGGAEAVYWAVGPAAAAEDIALWQPVSFALEASTELVTTLARQVPPEQLLAELAALKLQPGVEARLLAAAAQGGAEAGPDQVRRLALALAAEPLPDDTRDAAWTLEFAELVARASSDPQLVLGVLEHHGPQLPERAPYEHEGLGAWTVPLRLACLRAASAGAELEGEQLLPEDLREDAPQPKDYDERERRRRDRERLSGLLRRYLPVLALRARAMLERPDVAEIESLLREEVESRAGETGARWYRGDTGFRPWATFAAQAIVAAKGEASALVSEIAERAPAITASTGVLTWEVLAETLLPDVRYRDQGLALLDRVANVIDESEEPAGEKSSSLLTIAGLVDPYDSTLAGDYYARAIAASAGLDDEGAGALHVNARLAELAASEPDELRPALAERTARAVERYRPFVTEEAVLPLGDTVAAVASLDPVAGLALASRWDVEHRLGIATAVEHVLPRLLAQGYLLPEQALALLRLAGDERQVGDLAVHVLEPLRAMGAVGRARLAEASGALARLVTRDLCPETRLATAHRIATWLREYRLEALPGAAEIVALATFAETVEGRDAGQWRGVEESRNRERKIARIIAGAPGDRSDQIVARLRALTEDFGGDAAVEAYLERFGAGLTPTRRIDALDALADLPAEDRLWRWQAEGLLRTLSLWLGRWKASGPVQEWARERLPGLLREQLMNLVAYDETASVTLPLILALPLLDDPAGVLMQAVGPHLGVMRPSALFAVAGALAPSLAAAEQLDALDWSLRQLEPDGAPPVPTLPEGQDAALASLLWALLGHPDKRVRWRAAHSARQLLCAPAARLGAELVVLMSSRDAGAFGTAEYDFLWMSAQQWTLMVLARCAADAPASLEAEAHRIAEFALNPNWPHASAREFARRAALRLDERSGHHLEPDTRQALLYLNRAACSHKQRGAMPEPAPEQPRRDRDRAFYFSDLDTLPYWFNPLGHVFALRSDQVADRAERWVVERLGYNDEITRDADPPLTESFDYDVTSNRQGSIPRVERLHTYLEYHSMLLVAGELIDEHQPVVIPDYEDATDPWLDWLKRHVDASPDRWSCDVRAPVPLAPSSYGRLGPPERWRYRLDIEYDAELGLGAPAGGGDDARPIALVVDASCTVSSGDLYGSAYIASALVAPDTAWALLSALQTCEDPSDFALPYEVGGFHDMEIDEPPFVLTGWVRDVRIEEDGLEEHDPLRRIGLGYSMPGAAFTAHHGLNERLSGRELIDDDGRSVAWVEAWSDEPPPAQLAYYSPRAAFSEGRRTWVRFAELLDFLEAQAMDLIVEVRLTRHFSERPGTDREDRYDRGRDRIYLIRRDGTIETLAGGRAAR